MAVVESDVANDPSDGMVLRRELIEVRKEIDDDVQPEQARKANDVRLKIRPYQESVDLGEHSVALVKVPAHKAHPAPTLGRPLAETKRQPPVTFLFRCRVANPR